MHNTIYRSGFVNFFSDAQILSLSACLTCYSFGQSCSLVGRCMLRRLVIFILRLLGIIKPFDAYVFHIISIDAGEHRKCLTNIPWSDSLSGNINCMSKHPSQLWHWRGGKLMSMYNGKCIGMDAQRGVVRMEMCSNDQHHLRWKLLHQYLHSLSSDSCLCSQEERDDVYISPCDGLEGHCGWFWER